MSYLEKLLDGEEVCWMTLRDVADIMRGQRVTKRNLMNNGTYPVYSGGVSPMGYYDKYNQPSERITVVKYGSAGFVNFISEKFWANDVCYCVNPYSIIENKFLYYYLKDREYEIKSLATDAIPAHLPMESFAKIDVPIPPLSVQHKIVEILDNFTELAAELIAELSARRQQYEYYRDQLLTFGEGDVKWKPLGQVAPPKRGTRLVKSQLQEQGEIPVFQNSLQPLGYYHKSNCYPNMTFMITAGAAGEIGFSDREFWAADDCSYFECPKEILNDKFLYYFLLNNKEQLLRHVRKASVPRLGKTIIEKMLIPLPPIKVQERIVSILDKFDALTTSLTEGLPREIELRRKQYEYYRDMLLSFPKPE